MSNAAIYDAGDSFLVVQINGTTGPLSGIPQGGPGSPGAILFGPPGSESISMGGASFGPITAPGTPAVAFAPSGSFSCTAGSCSGPAALSGTAVIPAVTFPGPFPGTGPVGCPLPAIGVPGPPAPATAGAPAPVSFTGGPWTAGTAVIPGVSAKLLSITSGPRIGVTGIAYTLMPTPGEGTTQIGTTSPTINVAGTFSLSGTAPGAVTMVTPVAITATTSGVSIPASISASLRFVPEPGSMLLIGSAVLGLVTIGRNRMN